MRYTIIIFWILIPLFISCQENSVDELKKLEGIWIAQDYYNSFEKTKSVIKSKKAFDPSIPVGLRIKCEDFNNNIFTVGYSQLHSHELYPEIDGYVVINGDTIEEENSFKINLNEDDSSGYYLISKIWYHNYPNKAYLKYNFEGDTTITLYNPDFEKSKGRLINFVRVTTKFEKEYDYPNPLYYYLRSRILEGKYALKDSAENILSDNFRIGLNGITKGYSLFENKICYLSTDIYCGEPVFQDYIIICDKIEHLNDWNHYDMYFIKKKEDNLELYEYKYLGKGRDFRRGSGDLKFILERIN